MDARAEYDAALSTCPADLLIAAFRRALGGFDVGERTALLDAVRNRLLTGRRTSPGDTEALGRFVACAELRDPGRFLDALPREIAERLRRYVVIALPLLGPTVPARKRSGPLAAPVATDPSALGRAVRQPSDPHSVYCGVVPHAVVSRGARRLR